MAKVVAQHIGSTGPVWTIDSLLSRSLDNVNAGVENPAFYDSESGVAEGSKKVWSEDEGSKSSKVCSGRVLLLLIATFILLAVLLAMVAAVVYLAVGEVRSAWKDESEYQEIEEGISLVEGHLRITNRVFTKDLLSENNPAYRKLSTQIVQSMDAVFLHSLHNYNETRVISYREGSVVVRCEIHLSKARPDATHQVGMAVVQALERHHGYLPGGLLQVDIRSLHFTGLPDATKVLSEDIVEPTATQAITPSLSTTESEQTDCHGDCSDEEVCIFLPQTSFSRCLVPRDPHDPTGCGGWCASETQLCKRLANATFQCRDNLATCREDEWRCSNGLCITSKGRCNGRIECYDMSDEIDCDCEEGKFLCGNSTPCLPKDVRCDGRIDCWDASDEVNCTKGAPCGPSKFTCNDGRCIQSMLFCDRFPDCPDGSDEPTGCSDACLSAQAQCNNGRCVHSELWCNGRDDCGDASDEALCDDVIHKNTTFESS